MEYNCGFQKDNKWFRYRAAAIIIEDGCMLFAGNEKEDYYYSIGGAVHMGETAEDAVKREVLEETGVEYEIDHLAVIHENFFNENTGSLKGMNCHEIALCYLMKPRGTQNLNSNSYTSFLYDSNLNNSMIYGKVFWGITIFPTCIAGGFLCLRAMGAL